jgi:hypothetical protein
MRTKENLNKRKNNIESGMQPNPGMQDPKKHVPRGDEHAEILEDDCDFELGDYDGVDYYGDVEELGWVVREGWGMQSVLRCE